MFWYLLLKKVDEVDSAHNSVSHILFLSVNTLPQLFKVYISIYYKNFNVFVIFKI